MKISFDTTADSIEQVLEVIKAVYGVDLTLGGTPEAAQLQAFESVVVESDSGQEQGPVREPDVAAPAEGLIAAVEERAAEAPAKRTRSRSAVKTPAKKAAAKRAAAKKETAKPADAVSAQETAAAPAKKATAKKPAAKETASRKAGAPRSRKATEQTTTSEAATQRGSGTRALAAKSQSAQDSAKPEAKVVRTWARERGLENVSGRGTLPAWVYEQYAAAHA